MPLKRAAPHLRPCLLLPSCSLGWMQRSVQLRGGSRARGNLAVPVCMLPERWGRQTGHEDAITRSLQHPCFCSPDRQRWGRCWAANALKSTVRPCCTGVQPGPPRDPAKHQACVGLQLAQAVSRKGFFSRSAETSGSGCSPGAGWLWAHVRLCARCCFWYPAARALLLAPSSGQYRLQQTWKWNRNYSRINYSNISFYLKGLCGLLS